MTTPHPTFPPYSFDDAGGEVATSLIKYGDDPDQILEFYGESNFEKPTLLLIHGGYWRNLFDREHMRPLAVALAKEGFTVVLPEFRREAGAPETTLRDLAFAISTLEETALTVIGYSSGGHLALLLADKFPNIKSVIGLAPVTDMAESERLALGRGAVLEWLGCSSEQRPELDPMLRPPISAKTHLIHGSQDERVPLELSQKYQEAMKRHGKSVTLEILDGVSHFQMMDVPSPTFSAILRSIN
jgi:pimeloyl-ACP methyl ester carboxylesterase